MRRSPSLPRAWTDELTLFSTFFFAGSNGTQANLKSHNDSFDQLLRYIPAKFYIAQEEEETAPVVSFKLLQYRRYGC